MYALPKPPVTQSLTTQSYLVTDLMATDLHTLLKTKKVDQQFSQYFIYQIMVRHPHSSPNQIHPNISSVASNTSTQPASSTET